MSLANFLAPTQEQKQPKFKVHEANKMKKKDLKLETFIHLCNSSSNTNSKSIIFFSKRNPLSEMSFSLSSSNKSSTSMNHSKIKLSHLDQSNYLPDQNQGIVVKYDLTMFIRLVLGLVLGF
jgi:hypothetical protein